MNGQELTEWYPADVDPVRAGWYQREWGTAAAQSACDWWDGRNWHHGYSTGGWSIEESGIPLRWRGLAKEPK